MAHKNITVPLAEFRDDEPKYGRWVVVLGHTPPTFVSSEQVCKVIERAGNDIDGWRYVVEYNFTEGPERFFPPTFHIEPATEDEWNKQEPTVYHPQQNKRRWAEYDALPPSYISLSSGDWYEVTGDNVPEQLKGKVGFLELQNFCEERMEFATERHIINLLTGLGLKVKRVGSKY